MHFAHISIVRIQKRVTGWTQGYSLSLRNRDWSRSWCGRRDRSRNRNQTQYFYQINIQIYILRRTSRAVKIIVKENAKGVIAGSCKRNGLRIVTKNGCIYRKVRNYFSVHHNTHVGTVARSQISFGNKSESITSDSGNIYGLFNRSIGAKKHETIHRSNARARNNTHGFGLINNWLWSGCWRRNWSWLWCWSRSWGWNGSRCWFRKRHWSRKTKCLSPSIQKHISKSHLIYKFFGGIVANR